MHQSRGLSGPFTHLPNFAPAPPAVTQPVSQPDPYFLFVGRLEAIKGLQTVIPVFRNYPKARLLIAGSGNYEAELRALAGDSPNIQFLGFVKHEELAGLYQSAQAVIVPSLCYEMFGLVVVESFAHHTPIIARDIGGLTEIINDSGGGLLFSDDESLRAVLDRFADDVELHNRLGESGYVAYQQHWTPQVHVDRYLEIIEEIDTDKQKSGTLNVLKSA
jgi:glycosyltransferase involved in cell wall biosynthesis